MDGVGCVEAEVRREGISVHYIPHSFSSHRIRRQTQAMNQFVDR